MNGELIGALVGLAKATDGQEALITPTATALIVRALNAPVETAGELLRRAAEEKQKIVPNCATCAAPCGRTADYDMETLYTAEPEVREAKLRILAALRSLAADFRVETAEELEQAL